MKAERWLQYGEIDMHLRERRASEVMNVNVATIEEDAAIDEAIRIMTERGLKRLPVLDSAGKFKGMISRESLLRTAFEKQRSRPPWE